MVASAGVRAGIHARGLYLEDPSDGRHVFLWRHQQVPLRVAPARGKNFVELTFLWQSRILRREEVLTNAGPSLVSEVDTHSHGVVQGAQVLLAWQGPILLL